MLLDMLVKNKQPLSNEEAAKILKIHPEQLAAFESAYQRIEHNVSDNFFDINAKDAAEYHRGIEPSKGYPIDDIINRCVLELEHDVPVLRWDGSKLTSESFNTNALPDNFKPVSNEEILSLPETLRPQLTGSLYMKDIHDDVYKLLLDSYRRYIDEKDSKKKAHYYGEFRSGLDFMDLDTIMYMMLGMNPTSMGFWLPKIAKAISNTELQIPATTVFKVPLPILQLSRLEYSALTRTTLDIVDRFVKDICDLKEDKEYFIKTGIFSSKYDFRNCKVTGASEVRELGEYLLFISHQASQMAAPLTSPRIYGAATTNEWVVREYIKDTEDNPCIYHGMPLHTEYRAFVDFDEKTILGVVPYWEPTIMKTRFEKSSDSKDPDKIHDSVIYRMHEETLMKRYEQNKGYVAEEVQKLLDTGCDLDGQWSIDIMQNGNDFYLIDMATADTSALKEFIPVQIKKRPENWIPVLK